MFNDDHTQYCFAMHRTGAMVLMFRFASIPMMEEKILKTRPEYAKTIAAVPMLLPIPRKGVAGEKSSA